MGGQSQWNDPAYGLIDVDFPNLFQASLVLNVRTVTDTAICGTTFSYQMGSIISTALVTFETRAREICAKMDDHFNDRSVIIIANLSVLYVTLNV